ncbi:RHS repeat domain-containing protein [Litorimonas haliclonae]|uniref:RHS repeat domain-containing protein n=1 Tax=Litorimonas haliclonae TaxID=2081977 RepID=UPI0039EF0257
MGLHLLMMVCLLTLVPQATQAQFGGGGIGGGNDPEPIFPHGDIQSRYNSLNLDILDDKLVGDQIDIDTGSLSLSQMDVSIPGNSALPVQFGRKLSRSTLRTGMIGNWAPEIPHMSRNYTTIPSGTLGKNSNRCSGPLYPPTEEVYIGGQITYLRAEAYFNGYEISVPGQNPGKLIQARGSNNVIYSPEFSTTGARLVTTENWYVDCISSIPSGGEGYRAHAPNGDVYEFTHEVNTLVRLFDFGSESYPVTAETLYATKITDVHGNWIRFQYSGKNLTRIWANDGREITFTYSGNKLRTVNANGRTWTYTYSGSTLTRVDLPDGRYWSFTGFNAPFFALDPYVSKDLCVQPPLPDISIRHPSGTVAQFEFEAIRNGRKDVIFRQEVYQWINMSLNSGPDSAPPLTIFDCIGDGDRRSKLPSSFWSAAVVEKRLVLPNGPTHTWQRDYQEDQGSYDYPSFVTPWSPYDANLTDYKTRTVTDPEGHKTIIYVNRTFGRQEGQIMKVEIVPSGQSTPIRTTENEYINGNYVGLSLGARDHGYTGADSTRVYKVESVTTQHGDTFTTESVFETNPASVNFAYNSPSTTRSFSNVSTTPRETVTTYEHNKPKWILSLPKTITQNGRLMSEYVYNSDGQKIEYDRYGALYAKYGYNSNGTLAWAEDALSPPRRTQALNWHRGTPQRVIRPDGSDYEQTVDNNGWITSMTDPMNRVDNYTLDNMGRVTLVDPHGSWANTSVSYSFPSSGGAVQTITTGQGRQTIIYDGLYRPVLERSQALDTGWSSYVNTNYDGLGRVSFKSQPSTSSVHSQGTNYTYDALGRIKTETETAINAVTTHNYYSSHRHRVIDPTGAWTQYYSYGYDGPDNTDYRAIYKYGNGTYQQKTNIYKNVHGQMTRLRQSGNTNGFNVDKSHYFYYDSQQRLCRYYTPEGGATKYEYNNAGEMIRYAKGQSNSGCTVPNNNSRVSQSYDLLGRPTVTNFSHSGTPDITRTYDDNGNVLTVNRGSGGNAVNWAYSYNDADLLTHETLTLDGRTFPLSYSYNSSKHMTRRNYPNSFYTDLSPDGLGRARIAKYGSTYYANNATFHANGSVATFAYGNGQSFTQTLNNRLLPQRLLAVNGGTKALDLTYSYDSRAKVTSIIDGAMSGNNRSYGYDAMGRLTSASGPWGSGSVVYDAIDNIRSRTLGSRSITLNYDTSKNRVSQSIDTGATGTRTVAYDARGNVTTLGTLGMVYDYSDQPTAVSGTANGVGTANGTYRYDGNLKRVKSVVNGRTIYNVYDASGALAHVHELAASGQPEKRTDYVKLNGMAIARVENKTTPIYSFSDHLGSPVAVWKQGGSIERERYMPFGIAMDNPASLKDQAGFTGHIKDSATGLNYMQARSYDPVLGRFLSIDPVTFLDTEEPDYFNRYSYTANDPINYFDPNGEKKVGVRLGGEGAFVGGLGLGVQVTYDTDTGQFQTKTNFKVLGGFSGGFDAPLIYSDSDKSPVASGVSRVSTVDANATVAFIATANVNKTFATTTVDTQGNVSREGAQPTTVSVSQGVVDFDNGSDNSSKGKSKILGASLSAGVNVEHTHTSEVKPRVKEFVDKVIDVFD